MSVLEIRKFLKTDSVNSLKQEYRRLQNIAKISTGISPEYRQNIDKISLRISHHGLPQNTAKISTEYRQNIAKISLKISTEYRQNIAQNIDTSKYRSALKRSLKISPKYRSSFSQNIDSGDQRYFEILGFWRLRSGVTIDLGEASVRSQ